MAVSTLDRLRVTVADRPKLVLEEVMGEGDGVRIYFQFQLPIVESGSEVIYVDGAQQTKPEHYSLEEGTGLVTFVAAPAIGELVKAGKYKWTTFSDDELTDVLDQNDDNVLRSSIDVIQWLLADTDRFIKYFLGQEMIDRTEGIKALQVMIERFESVIGAPAGLVIAADGDTYRECLMFPFIEQECVE